MNHALALWEYAMWGAFGGVAVEAIGILGAVKRTKGLPWNQPGEITLGALLFTVLVRLGLGAGLAVALGEGSQISGAVGAVAAGVAAPLILEQLGKQLSAEEVKHKRRTEADYIERDVEDRHRAEVTNDKELRERLDDHLRRMGRYRDAEAISDRRRMTDWVMPLLSRAFGTRLISFAREVAFGLARSTPAFGGTAEL